VALVTCLFKILNHAELCIGGAFDAEWGSPKARGMLAVLVTRPGEWFSTAELRDWMWTEDEPLPKNMPQTFYGYANKIREALKLLPEPARLESRKGSYRVVADRMAVDFFIARALIEQARDLGPNDYRKARLLVKRALEFWSDTPLADLPGELAQRWRRRARERIWTPAYNALCDGYLAEGNFRAVLELLDDLPVREAEPLMLIMCRLRALFGLARHQEMVECYTMERRRLREEFDHGSADALKSFYDRLAAGPLPEGPAPVSMVVTNFVAPHQLPRSPDDFVGRDVLLPKLDAVAGLSAARIRPAVVLLDGAAGVGKTALAVHWGNRVRDRFPDGQLYVDLDGFSPDAGMDAATVVDRLLEGVGIDIDHIATPDRRARKLGAVLSDRSMLVLLDNVRSTDQIRPVLPPLGSCVVLVTSRVRLPGVGRCAFEVRLLSDEHAVDLLARRIGERAAVERVAVTDLVELCAGLPLALDLVAQHIAARPGAPLGEFVRQLQTERRLLDIGDHGAGTDISLRTVFSWSYGALREADQRRFRLLGLHAGPDIGIDAAVALLGEDRADARQGLDLLVDAHLVEQQGSLHRFRLQDLLRTYAAECARAEEAEADRSMAELRLVDFFLHTAKEADAVTFPFRPGVPVGLPVDGVVPTQFVDDVDARYWCVEERGNLHAVMDLATRRGWHDRVCQIAHAISDSLSRHGHYGEVRSALTMAIGSAQLERDSDAEAAAYNDLGLLCFKQSDFMAARKYFHLAHAIAQTTGNDMGLAVSLHMLARLDVAQGNLAEAVVLYDQVLELARTGRFRELEAGTLHRLGEVALRRNHRSHAARCFHDALVLRESNLPGQADTLTELAELHRQQGELRSAENHLDMAMRLHLRTRDLMVAGRSCEVFAMVRRDHGDLTSATHYARRAVECFDRVGNSTGKAVALDLLATIRWESNAVAAAEEGWEQALQILRDAGDVRASAVAANLARFDAQNPIPRARGPAVADRGVRQ
jgi:tetratricopeptide (TPR) repeat protein